MSSGGKSGSAANQSKYHYGTLVGAVGWGPWDWITAIIHNGNYIFQGNLTLTEDVTDLTGAILDPALLGPGGSLKFYRGTETQPADITGCRDKGTAKLEAVQIFFGQDSGTAPNLQVIGGGLPRVSTAIVAGADNVAEDGQVNPIAAFAEILLDERGGDLALATLDAPSWLAAGHWAYLNREYTFCSPLVTEQAALREFAKQLLEPFNGFCRWTNSGKLACNVYEWGSDPGGLPVLDARHWTKRPRFPLADWDDVPTELLISYTNRDYEYQEDSHLVPNARAADIRQEEDQRTLKRPHVTRPAQIHRHGVEYLRRVGTAPTKATVSIRQPFIGVLDLKVGDKIKIDTDPEPGGGGLAQLCRIERIVQDRSDEAQLIVMTDNLVPATAYTPTWNPPVVDDEVSPPLEHFLGVPLPPNAWGWPPSVALLATRPSAKVLGFEAYFGTSHAGAFADLGQQAGFAVRCSLAADALAAATSLAITQLDGLDAPDAGIAANTPGGNTTEAGDNVLLALIAELDGDGRIALGADGDPLMEFVSIVDRAPSSGATYDYDVLRGRMGTTARDWTAGATCWIVPRVNLTPWRHSLLSAMLGGVAYFRLVSFTARATDESTPVPECSVNMLPATAPMYGGNIDNDVSPDEGVAPNPVSGVTVTSGIEQLILRWTNPTNVPLRRIFIRESVDMSMPALPQFVLAPGQTFLFRTGLSDGATRYYWIEVQGVNGRKTNAGPFSGTVVVWPVVSDILDQIEGETNARILADNGLGEAITEEATTRGGETGSLAAEYVLKVVTGGGSGQRVAGMRVTNLGGATGETEFIIQADKFAVVNESGDDMRAPFAVVDGVVYIDTAYIKDGSITNAMINDLLADKITAGTLLAMVLKAATVYTDFACANEAAPGNTMPTVTLVNDQDGTHYTSLGAGGTEIWLPGCTLYGWSHGSGTYDNRFGKSSVRFICLENGGSTPATGSFVDLEIICRVNGGSTVQITPYAQRATDGNGSLNINGGLVLTGLDGGDEIEFGVRAKSTDPASQLNVANLTVMAMNL